MSGIVEKIGSFELTGAERERLEEAKNALNEFLRKYPFREHPDKIDELTEEEIYNVGSDDYFFLWVEHKTKKLGAIFTYGGRTYPNALLKIDLFKNLLKITVDDTKDIQTKIDADWDQIKGFGGDRLIAKKILFCYYSDSVLPIFKTEHLELFADTLDLDYKSESINRKGKKVYENLSIGEKYELLNDLILQFKNEHLPDIDNYVFTRALYKTIDIPKINRYPAESRPLNKLGLLFSPQYEQEVVYLFSNFHKELGFPYINSIQTSFPDVSAIDSDRKTVTIELEVYASGFLEHNHEKSGCDYIVCWENDIVDVPEDFPEIISLKEFIEEFLNI